MISPRTMAIRRLKPFGIDAGRVRLLGSKKNMRHFINIDRSRDLRPEE
jgi:hypothetical protein